MIVSSQKISINFVQNQKAISLLYFFVAVGCLEVAMPGTFSKGFNAVMTNKTCADLLHPGLTCTGALKTTLINSAFGSMKFYGPIVLVPMLLKMKNWGDVKTWKNFATNCGRCWLFGFIFVFVSFSTLCGF